MSLFQALDSERQTLGACINLLRDMPNILLYTIQKMQKQKTETQQIDRRLFRNGIVLKLSCITAFTNHNKANRVISAQRAPTKLTTKFTTEIKHISFPPYFIV